MDRIELNDIGFREAEYKFIKANAEIVNESEGNESGFISKKSLDNLDYSRKEYWKTAGELADRLTRKYRKTSAGKFGEIHHFNVHEEQDSTFSMICVCIETVGERELSYNLVRSDDLKKEIPDFDVPF